MPGWELRFFSPTILTLREAPFNLSKYPPKFRHGNHGSHTQGYTQKGYTNRQVNSGGTSGSRIPLTDLGLGANLKDAVEEVQLYAETGGEESSGEP